MIVLGLLLQLFTIRSVLAVCLPNCSSIPINYPFGTDISCSLPGFELSCDQSQKPPKLFLGDSSLEVFHIFYSNSSVLVKTKVISANYQSNYNESWSVDLPTNNNNNNNMTYVLSTSRNKFVAIGCNVLAQLISSVQKPQRVVVSACAAVCAADSPTDITTCSGIGCCKSSIPTTSLIGSFEFELTSIAQTPSSATNVNVSNRAFVAEESWIDNNVPAMGSQLQAVPVLLEWYINGQSCTTIGKGKSDYKCVSDNSDCIDYNNNGTGIGYRCKCSDGFDGNPYVKDGCQDINECDHKETYPCYGTCVNRQGSYDCYCSDGKASSDPKKAQCVAASDRGLLPFTGVLTIVGVGIFVCLLSLPIAIIMLLYKLKARRLKKLKDKFFKENHGFLLQQLISSNKDIAERMKIFSLEDLEKATNNFDPARIVGSGGHGTVYKGILSDQRVVAIKKSKVKVQKETQEFINEVIILSQINHRNVVKLYGCCLESEVPMLVYEFISNGALSHRLHGNNNNCRSLPWQDRTRIALETARALAYLHTAASISVFHRDIKTANILLDDSLTAKLSDFGASRSVPLTETGVTTVIQGTYGYLDPEYYYTGRLTEKSDVYSYGMILVELLTRMPAASKCSPDGHSLSAHFMTIMREKRLYEIVDQQVVEEGKASDVDAVAALAEACLNIKGDERPTMKEIEMRLENLLGLRKRSSKRSVSSTPRRLYENQELLRMISTEESSSSERVTRQYSLEEEYLVDNYPR